ncbi:MAG: celM [Comamonadaceae bacterium]|nr:MAG: celM [Comamonadaceae bacterium]
MAEHFFHDWVFRPISAALGAAALVGMLVACGGSGEPDAAVLTQSMAAGLTQAPSSSQTRSAALLAATPNAATVSTTMFSNGLYGSGVENWSWNLCNTKPTALLGGLKVLLFNECQGGNWSSGGYLHLASPAVNAQSLEFEVYLGAKPAVTARQISLYFGSGTADVNLGSLLPAPVANAWNLVKLDLSTVLKGQAFQAFMLMNASGHPKFYVNNVVLGTASSSAIDAKANVHDISPLVYGVAAFDNVSTVMSTLNSPINRHGGNATSAYNWKINASGRGSDWYFESVPDDANGTAAGLVSSLVQGNRTAGAQSMITVPMLPWVAKLAANRDKLASFSVAKYGQQQQTDAQWMPDAGNGVRSDGSLITGNDPADAHTRSDEFFQDGMLRTLTQQFGTASSGGVRYYVLDNEHSLWHKTHRDVYPQGAGMDDVFDAMRRYAGMVRAADPSAQIVGPEEWGWSGYLYSGKDLQIANWSNPPDRAAHGGMDYMPWLLQKIRQHETATGNKLLDVFSLHYYPQSGEYSNDVSTTTQELRNVSTRCA